MNLGPGAGDPGRAVPPPGNENFMELSADNANKQRPFVFVLSIIIFTFVGLIY